MNGFNWGKQPVESRQLENINRMFFKNILLKKCTEHLTDCSRMGETFFRIYPFLYENKKNYASLKSLKLLVMRWRPQLNTYQ